MVVVVAVTAAVAPTTTAAVIVESAAEGVGAAAPPLLVVAAEAVVAGPEGRRRGAGELPILAAVVAAAEVAARGELVAGRVQFPDRCVCVFFPRGRAGGVEGGRIREEERDRCCAVLYCALLYWLDSGMSSDSRPSQSDLKVAPSISMSLSLSLFFVLP